MAYRTNNPALILQTLRQFVETRGSIYQDPAYPSFRVVCKNHPGVDIPVSMCSENILDAVHEAFDSCVGCALDAHSKQQWENTRFPEDAEL